jgi:GxxExxY protein
MDYLIRMISEHIWNDLGPGYSESVYHNAFEVALRLNSVNYETERIIPIFFQGHNVGNMRSDLIIDNSVVVELKSISKLKQENRNQVNNYMKLLKLNHGILVNFPSSAGPVEIEIFNNSSNVSTDSDRNGGTTPDVPI